MTENLTLAIVLGAAVVDSINPCAIGVILFLATVLLRVADDRRALLRLGTVYVATVYVVYTLSGLGLIWFQHQLIGAGWAEAVGIAVGSLVVVLGLVELKDVFWYGRGPSLEIAPRHRQRIEKLAERISLLGVISVGGFVAMVELPCTGGPYLAITALLAKSFDLRALVYLLVYNVIFVLPLVTILLLIHFGASTRALKRWRQEGRRWMNLATGLLMLGLGGFLIAYYGMAKDAGVAPFARCLEEKGVVLYGSASCQACRVQRQELLGVLGGFDEVECHPHAPGSQYERCVERGIRLTPTWLIERDGRELSRREGMVSAEALAAFAGCELGPGP